jgi:hypothetical protein
VSRKSAKTQDSARARCTHHAVTPRLLPLKEAARFLGLTTWSLREAVWRGDIPVVRFPGGRKMFVDTQDMEAFIERNKVTIR